MTFTDSRCFIDTNILVYAYDIAAGRKRVVAADIVKNLWEKETGVLSVQVMQELFIVLTKKLRNQLPWEKALDIIEDYQAWFIISPEAVDVIKAIRLHRKWKLSFWDAMIIRAAVMGDCRYLLSEDLPHGQTIESVQIMNPFM